MFIYIYIIVNIRNTDADDVVHQSPVQDLCALAKSLMKMFFKLCFPFEPN